MMMSSSILQHVNPQAFRVPSAKASMPPRESAEIAARRSLAASRTTVQRLAALLSGISRNNSYEGRGPCLIPDSLTSGFVADLLGVKVSDLAESLVELEHLGLVTQAQTGGVRLTNLRALEGLGDAH